MSARVDIIIVGHLSQNDLWSEKQPQRASLATTTLIRSADSTILVDPSVDGEVMARCLFDRSGLRPEQIDAVFLTSFHPTHRRGLSIFDRATWLLSQPEQSAVTQHLTNLREGADAATTPLIERELELLARVESPDDKLADQVHLFPSVGATPGCTALLIAGLQTTVVTGDAVLTRDHFEQGKVWDQASDTEKARSAVAEINEIADLIIPGHDNLFPLSLKMM
ncbi:MAG: MBL fold metallo-hydrolase [Planctomycetes bacterium]|nr:MBL fold metallo-hydrolase [Planctomycetota bacterium]